MTTYRLKTPLKAITTDSRKVQAGSLFLAYPGDASDGRNYIADAIKNGASAVIWETSANTINNDNFNWNPAWDIENIGIKQLRLQAGSIASQFYKEPSTKMWMIGVTGTNGKTSITQWLSQCFNYCQQKTAVIGTLGNGLPDALTETRNTTPDAVQLQGLLADYVQQDVKTVAMEVSSHGLQQGRVRAIDFDIAVLSNLTRDHLDYHKTFGAYASAKRCLFEHNDLKTAILNADDNFGRQLEKDLKLANKTVMTYGILSQDNIQNNSQSDIKTDISASNIEFASTHFSFDVTTPFGNAAVKANLVGKFNVYNVLAVLATLLASKINLSDAVAAISHITPAKGRMQMLGGGDFPLVVVDYAHTPDALEKVLDTLQEQAQAHHVVCVFGCGGNRDTGKRAMMGKVASDHAFAVVVTSDNPRDEAPEDIIADILKGVHDNFIVEPDRAKAITIAILSAKVGDIVLIAGKGHEEYQEIAGVKHYFSDIEHAKEVLKIYAEAAI